MTNPLIPDDLRARVDAAMQEYRSRPIESGQRRVFKHAFSPGSSLTEYEAHHGQEVTILRPCVMKDGFDAECLPQWWFRADDGWEGHGWPSELQL